MAAVRRSWEAPAFSARFSPPVKLRMRWVPLTLASTAAAKSGHRPTWTSWLTRNPSK
ncbi:unnamed protein product, partial [Nesidiocoris tenuis]